METIADILGLFIVVLVVCVLAFLAMVAIDRVLGLGAKAEPRYPTPFLARAQRTAPLARASIWVVAALVVTAFVLSREPRTLAVVLVIPLALGIGLALRDYFANVIAGVLLAVNRPFSVGDNLELEDVTGVVLALGLGHVRLMTRGGREVRIPNRRFIADEYRMSRSRLRDVAAELLFDPPPHLELTEAKRLAYTSAAVSRYASPRRRPEVFVETEGSDVHLRVRAYACAPEHLDAYRSEITEIWLENV